MSNLEEILGVRIGEVYEFRGCKYMLERHRGYTVLMDNCANEIKGTLMLCEMINHPEEIKRLPIWDTETIEDAKAIKRLLPNRRFVAREKSGLLRVFDYQPIENKIIDNAWYGQGGDYSRLSGDCFPSLTFENSPQKLEDIINGG